MLRLRGKVDTPQQFFSPRNNGNHTQHCQLCEGLFTEDLYTRLRSSGQGLTEIQSSHELLARDIHDGMLKGCNMCAILGNSVLTATRNELPYHDEETFRRYIPWYQSQKPITTTSIRQDISQDNDGDNDFHKGLAYAYFAGLSPESTSGGLQPYKSTEIEPELTFSSLGCDAKIFLKMIVIKGDYLSGFDLITIDIEARPSENCPKPWIFITPYGATLWLEVISNSNGVFAAEWKSLSATEILWPDNYVTLSYVWGTKQDYVLTQGTLRAKLDGLDVQKIPKSVGDAMEVSKRLGFPYLWVDALCIIQDSPEDKLKELPLMAKIYQHGAVTISAASSPAASGGFLKPPIPPVFKVQPFQITIGRGVPQFPHVNLSLGFREERPDFKDPIDSRGWTLQEWVLSSCRLRFTSRGVQWTCNKLIADPSSLSGEEYRDPPIQFSPDGYTQTYFGEASAIISAVDSNTRLSHKYVVDEAYKRKEMSTRWIEIRSQYAQRSLSFPGDKLAAISAVASMAAEEHNMTYLAGLWKEALLVDLQWYYIFRSEPTNRLSAVSTSTESHDEYAAPSWSWASVKYDNGTLYPKQSRKWTTDRPWNFKILDCAVTPVDGSDFSFGPVKSGYLVAEGRVLDVEWEPWIENTVALNKVMLYDSPRRKATER
ncbi:HET-domain-containing protein [Hypoxylon trugodes]|uniref:HET-domain-containing protein n=1 Tax=Hypoxylon trugodes TaxID=326681 RepID=UPI00219FB9EA|nr:HET-domain-containing protein [Hypoxylon trugodes]KAI1384354.1 HET-domain-containing protein [Hypoxylon trugodes]